MASTAIHGREAIAGLDPSRSGPGTVIRSVFAGRRSGPSDAVLSGSPVGAAGDESSCSVSSSEKCRPGVPGESAVCAHYDAGRVGGQGGTPANPIRRHGG
jgi:hypothetical protein